MSCQFYGKMCEGVTGDIEIPELCASTSFKGSGGSHTYPHHIEGIGSVMRWAAGYEFTYFRCSRGGGFICSSCKSENFHHSGHDLRDRDRCLDCDHGKYEYSAYYEKHITEQS